MSATAAAGPGKGENPATLGWRRWLQLVVTMAIWVAMVFVGAGRWNWLRGWIAVSTYLFAMAVISIMVKLKNPGLLAARANWRHNDTKLFDKIFLRLLLPLTFVQPALAGLEVRLHGSVMPVAFAGVGFVIFGLGIALIAWTMVVNPFAESTVRIQTDRGHQVIASGPYHYVRHPMYAGTILMYPGLSLIFGSMWALAVAGLIVVMFLCRTVLEDRTLRGELAGYEEFAAHTRFRLIPGIW